MSAVAFSMHVVADERGIRKIVAAGVDLFEGDGSSPVHEVEVRVVVPLTAGEPRLAVIWKDRT